jgi:hypothetical protein
VPLIFAPLLLPVFVAELLFTPVPVPVLEQYQSTPQYQYQQQPINMSSHTKGRCNDDAQIQNSMGRGI